MRKPKRIDSVELPDNSLSRKLCRMDVGSTLVRTEETSVYRRGIDPGPTRVHPPLPRLRSLSVVSHETAFSLHLGQVPQILPRRSSLALDAPDLRQRPSHQESGSIHEMLLT